MGQALKGSYSLPGKGSQDAAVYLLVLFRRGLFISWMILVLPTCNASCHCLTQEKAELENSLSVSNRTQICHRTCHRTGHIRESAKTRYVQHHLPCSDTQFPSSAVSNLVLSKTFSVTGAAADLSPRRNLPLPRNTSSLLLLVKGKLFLSFTWQYSLCDHLRRSSALHNYPYSYINGAHLHLI